MKSHLSRVIALVLCVLLVVGFASCAGSDRSLGSGDGGVQTMDKMNEIKARGKIIIGVALGGIPMGFYNEEGEPDGYDTDWAKKMAEILDVDLEIIEVDGETRIAAILSGQIDCCFANMTGNLTRAQSVAMSIPYLRVGIKMLTTTGSGLETIDDLDDPNLVVAVGRGTTGEALVLEHNLSCQLTYVNAFTEQVLMLEQGKCDAAFEDSTLCDYAAKNSNGVLYAPPMIYSSDPICVGCPIGDMYFLYWVNHFISWQITQGWQQETYRKWWGEEPAPLETIW